MKILILCLVAMMAQSMGGIPRSARNDGASIERPLPQSLAAERSVLGAVLLDNAYLDVAGEKLRAADFFLEQHRRIYARMVEMREAQRAIDTLTLTDELQRHGELASVGGEAYLYALVDGVPRISNVEHYARIVREKALLRNLAHTAYSIEQKALEAEEGADEILDAAESLIFQLADDRLRGGLRSAMQVVTASYERMGRMLQGERRISGLATGYARLDELTLGLQDAELILLAARPSMGKTALALNIAENVALRAEEPRAVAIFSLEMSEEALLMRLVGSNAPLDMHEIRGGQGKPGDSDLAAESIARIGEAPLWIDDAASTTVLEIAAKARRLKREKGLSLVIVDYLQLIAGRGKFGNRTEEVSSVSRGLKALAKELKIPVLALSQLTRKPEQEDRRPQLADLRESGALEQDADVVLFIHRPNFYVKQAAAEDKAEAELIIAKNRNGPTELTHFIFREKYTRFEEKAAGF